MEFDSKSAVMRKYWKIAKKELEIGRKVYPFSIVDGDSKKIIFSKTFNTCILVSVYVIVGYTTFKIRQILRENARRQAKRESKRTARQITYLMILQASTPFIVFVIPVIM
jgi:hypothetical protein